LAFRPAGATLQLRERYAKTTRYLSILLYPDWRPTAPDCDPSGVRESKGLASFFHAFGKFFANFGGFLSS
jgi:hypothetical protein